MRALTSAAMRAERGWDDFLHAPDSKLRVELLARGFWALFGFDALRRAFERTRDFDGALHAAQVPLLDDVFGRVSNARVECALAVTASTALYLALGPGSIGVAMVATIAFTYTWASTIGDTFQHHYLLTLLAAGVTFLPRTHDGPEPIRPWSARLIAVTLSVVYFFTALTKTEPLWLSGKTVEAVTTSSATVRSLVPGETLAGLPWGVIGAGIIAVELFLALTLWRAGRLDKRLAWAALLLGVGLHGSTLLLDMRFGLFPYYLLLILPVLLIPTSALDALGTRARSVVGAIRDRASGMSSRALGLLTIVALVAVALCGQLLELELRGAGAGFFVAAVVIGVDLVRVRGDAVRLFAAQRACILAALAPWVMAAVDPVELSLYSFLARWFG